MLRKNSIVSNPPIESYGAPTNRRAHDLYTPTAPLKVQVLLLAVRLIRVVDARPDAPLALLAQALGN